MRNTSVLPQEPRPPEAGSPGADAGAKPHICFLAPTTWPILTRDPSVGLAGGAELQQTLIATTLAKRGYRVSMVSIDWGQKEGTEAQGVRVYNLHKPDEGVPVLRFFHPRMTSVFRALKRVDADVYFQRTAAIYTGYLAAFSKVAGKRCIYSGASDVDFQPGKQDIAYTRDRLVFEYGLRRVDRVVVQNENQLGLLRKNYGREGLLIPNCYEAPPGARADRQGYILWVAMMRHFKRPHLALEIARRLPQHKFVIIGGPDGSRKGDEIFREVSEGFRQLPNVEFKGMVPMAETERYFDGARVFLNTSSYEGFPNTFLQAWARGLPCVGMCDVGSHGPSGPVYDLTPGVDEAVAAVDRLMADDLQWHQHSQRVLAHHRDTHSVEAVVDQYEREFVSLARKP